MKTINAEEIWRSYDFLRSERVEKVYLSFIDPNMNSKAQVQVGFGAESSAILNREEVVKQMLNQPHTYGVVLVHNHPFQEAINSEDDDKTTELVQSICHLMGRQFIDHIIVSENEFYSYKMEMRTKYVSHKERKEGLGKPGDNDVVVLETESRKNDIPIDA